MTAERIDIGEALATEWLPEVHTAIFASATMTVSKSFEHFNHAVGSIASVLQYPHRCTWTRATTSIRTWLWSLQAISPIRAIVRAILRRSSACWSTPILPWADRCSRCSPIGATWKTCTPALSPRWPVRVWSSTASSATHLLVACATGLSTSRPPRFLRLRPSGRIRRQRRDAALRHHSQAAVLEPHGPALVRAQPARRPRLGALFAARGSARGQAGGRPPYPLVD